MAAKMTAEVVWRPSEEDGNVTTVAVAATKATMEGGRVVGRRSSRGDRSDSRRRVQRLSSDVIDDHRSTSKSWSIIRPNNDSDGGGGGGSGGGCGEKNCHTPSSYRRRTAILPDCTDSPSGALDVVHCRRISVGGVGGVGGVGSGGAHPSDDRKDNDESGGRGGTRHHRGDCNDVAGYCRRHISQDCDQDYDDDNDNAGHTNLSGQRDGGSAPLLLPLLPPLLPLLSAGGTVLLICAHP